jgi:hypothetical protein
MLEGSNRLQRMQNLVGYLRFLFPAKEQHLSVVPGLDHSNTRAWRSDAFIRWTFSFDPGHDMLAPSCNSITIDCISSVQIFFLVAGIGAALMLCSVAVYFERKNSSIRDRCVKFWGDSNVGQRRGQNELDRQGAIIIV